MNRSLIAKGMCPLTEPELSAAMCQAAGYVKLVCGVGNNAAHMAMLECYDHAKLCRNYKHEVKRAFKSAIDEWHTYEKHLLHEQQFRMFHVPDMPENIRRKYGDISDREYYEYWAFTGGRAYERTRPLLTSLQNKYRKSLVRHDYKDADHVAWVMVGMSCLELACSMQQRVILDCPEYFSIPKRIAQMAFGCFSLVTVRDKWNRALLLLTGGREHPLDTAEERDITLGIEQLTDAWVDSSLHFQSAIDTAEEYGEVFRTKGMQKMVIRQCAEALAEENEQ
jgi:hypothetical protein